MKQQKWWLNSESTYLPESRKQSTVKHIHNWKELDEKIKAVEKQLPAHSIKPPIMTQLFQLEDERDAVFKELARLKQVSAE